MEPYACVVAIDEAGRIQVWANNKVPYTLRKQLADALGFAEAQIVVHPCGIGGDFGGKSPAMNVPLAYFLALRAGRPVKMIMSYTEELMAGNPRHPAVVTIKTGVKNDGTFWARHSTVVYNGGAYSGFGAAPDSPAAGTRPGGSTTSPMCRSTATWCTPTTCPAVLSRAGTAPGGVRGGVPHGHDRPRDGHRSLRLAAPQRAPGWPGVRHRGTVQARPGRGHLARRRRSRPLGGAEGWPVCGAGIALGQRPQGQSVYSVTVSMDAQARATFYTLVPETGTGAHTVGRQVVAEDLGIPVEDVTAVQLDTDGGATDAGAGSGSSVGGTHAALGAAQGVRQHLTFLAAQLYGWPAERIVFRGGRVFVEGDPDQGVPIQEVASRAVAASGAPSPAP